MGNCIVVAQFDLPKHALEQAVTGAISTAPIDRSLTANGVILKDHLSGDVGTGGTYLCQTNALSGAWFTEDLTVDLTRRFGASPRLTRYDTHVTVDNRRGARQRYDAGGIEPSRQLMALHGRSESFQGAEK